MTFTEWYAQNVEPTLPNDIPSQLREAAREQMARCWNAALDAVNEAGGGVDFVADEPELKRDTVIQCVRAVRNAFAAAIKSVRV